MIIRHTGSDPAIVLDESDVFKGFAVDAAGADLVTLTAALETSGAGRVEGDEAFVSIDFTKTAAGEKPAEWTEQFDGMIAYATSKKWVTEDGKFIQAHIENLAS